MPAIVDIRRRIKSVKNTQQITKAMKMVAASKLRRATERIMAAIADLLPPEAREKRVPTDDELRSTYPDGRLPTDPR